MSRVVVTFQIPHHEDREIGDGTLQPPYRWKMFMKELYRRYDGYTEAGEWAGVWRSEKTGKKVHDVSRVFQVDVPEEELDEFRELLRRACKTFRQQAIRMIVRGEAELVRGGPDDEPL